jgi:hypothetical protein
MSDLWRYSSPEISLGNVDANFWSLMALNTTSLIAPEFLLHIVLTSWVISDSVQPRLQSSIIRL